MVGAPPSATENNVFLVGRPPIAEYLSFLVTQMIDGDRADQGVLAAEWRTANDHVVQLEKDEAGYADGAAITTIQAELSSLEQAALADPMFKRSFQTVPWHLGQVELDRLVVFQKRIGLGGVARIQAQLGASPTVDAIFRLCIPIDHPSSPPMSVQRASNGWIFGSPSNDIRLLDATLVTPGQISGYQPNGAVAAVVGLMVGFSSNVLHVLHIENRLILMNGSHRAYALRHSGVSHVPCIVLELSRRDELDLVGPEEVKAKPDNYLKAARPPLLKDYFDPKLRKIVPVRRMVRQLQVGYGANTGEVPAS